MLGLTAVAGTTVLCVLLAETSRRELLPLSRWGRTGAGSGQVEEMLVGALAAIGAAIAAWYALSAVVGTLCALAQLCGATWRAGEGVLRTHGAPGVGRLVGAGAGAVLAAGLSLTPAQAEPPEPTPDPTIAEDLTWAAASGEPSAATDSTERADSVENGNGADSGDEPTAAEPAATTVAHPPSAEDHVPPAAQHGSTADYVVQPGDSLWTIAAAHLGPDADNGQIAAAWPRWYAANSAAIGTDPDLILPGTPLSRPD